MADPAAALQNLGRSAVRRVLSLHKPLVRVARRRARSREHAAMADRVRAIEAEIAQAVAGDRPVIAGPWLAEVGYEALYWVPFLRWVQDRYRVAPERLIAVSRGGAAHWYRDVASRYVDVFDILPPEDLVAQNDQRRAADEGGGRKQTQPGALDDRLLASVRTHTGVSDAGLLHPSLLFRLFRDVWQGNLALDVLWSRTRYARVPPPPRPEVAALPSEYVAVKLYSGTALPDGPRTRAALRQLVEVVAERLPVVLLDTGLAVDEHADYRFDDLPNVMSARSWMTPRDNLALQTALIAHSGSFIGTCGGLAWLAPFLGVPTIAVFADDALVATHLAVARQAGRRAGAADFVTVDLRALDHLGARIAPVGAAPSVP